MDVERALLRSEPTSWSCVPPNPHSRLTRRFAPSYPLLELFSQAARTVWNNIISSPRGPVVTAELVPLAQEPSTLHLLHRLDHGAQTSPAVIAFCCRIH